LERVNCALEEKRQGAGALQNASRGSGTLGSRASVLECGGPPPLWHVDTRNFPPHKAATASTAIPHSTMLLVATVLRNERPIEALPTKNVEEP